MNDDAFDALLRQGLLCAAQEDLRDLPCDAALPELSPAYLHQRMRLTANPFGYAKRKLRPVWQKALRSAASLLLAGALGLGAAMAVSPSVRADVVQWLREIYETHVIYWFGGEQQPITAEMPQYEIGELPEGYVEVIRNTAPGYFEIIYENKDGLRIYFSYMTMQQGGASMFYAEQATVMDVLVNGLPGQFFQSENAEISSALAWVDEAANLFFSLDLLAEKNVILHIAESVILCK